MSLLGELKPKRGSVQAERRIGRGNGSGWGGTAGKGHKGQKARAGAPIPRGFEGGQMPMARRLPKFGFTNTMFRRRYEVINLDQLEKFDGEVSPESLKSAGLVKKGPVKILGRGQLSKTLTVKAHKFSGSAKEAIEKSGGKAEVVK